ncbi:MAG: D-2-hydroxyacid dehydrogenase [bacterium]|nr:D-2-hydroxyacid dehydrogenase [bacterium]
MSKLRIHVAALSSQPEVFWVTEARVRAARRRHPDLSRQVSFDWSWELDRFDEGIAKADIMIGWRFPRDDFRARAPHLKWIQLTGAGTEHLRPFDWVPRGLALTNNSGVHGDKASEFVGTAVLMLAHGIPFLATQQRQRRWQKKFTTTAEGKTAVIIGLGGMGGSAARWLKQRLDMTVIGVTRNGRPHRYADQVVTTRDLDRVLPKADVVIVAAPLTAETENLLDRRRLERMKPGAGLVNMGRARIIDYDALADLLEDEYLSGAVLDVFDPEPLPRSSRLWATRNLIMTPHCSSDDVENYVPKTLDMFFANLARFIDGRPLKNRIKTGRQY